MTENSSAKRESMYDRFCRAAQLDADNWRDPEHDLEAIRLATPDERSEIEQFLLLRGITHYIDAEALALLDTPKSQQALLEAFRTGSTEIRAAVARVAPELIPNEEQLSELIQRVDECDAYKGLDLTLRQIEELHPLAVIEKMLYRIVREPGVVAVHYAAMLFFLHGQATSSFDWDQRPFFLRFNAGDETDRERAFVELCVRLGYSPAPFLDVWPNRDQQV